MFKIISVSLLAITLLGGVAKAVQCPTFPNPLTNGTTADANAVMADLMYLQDCPALGTNPSFTGSMGIGTTTPGNLLEVRNSGTFSPGLRINNGTGYWQLGVGVSAASDGKFSIADLNSGSPNRLVIDTGGNLGVGTLNPQASLDTYGGLLVRGVQYSSSGSAVEVQNVGSGIGTISMIANGATRSFGEMRMYGSPITFWPSGGLAVTIASGGNVGIGTTAPAEALDTGAGAVRAAGFRGRAGLGGATSNVFNINWTGSAAQLWIDTTNVGTISTVSDRRLKQQIATEPDTGLSRVMQLRPVTFHWRNINIFHDDGMQHEGFIADELQTVIPSAVVNNKDQVDANGKPVYQSIVPSEIIPVLTKALQEQQQAMQAQQAEIDILKSQIAALQAAQSTAH